jgi:hypothetical protein
VRPGVALITVRGDVNLNVTNGCEWNIS